MGFVGIFWKNNIQEAYLRKTSIVGQVVGKILAPLCSDDSIQITQVQFKRICRARRCDPWGRQCDQLLLSGDKFSCLVANLALKIGDFLLLENVH